MQRFTPQLIYLIIFMPFPVKMLETKMTIFATIFVSFFFSSFIQQVFSFSPNSNIPRNVASPAITHRHRPVHTTTTTQRYLYTPLQNVQVTSVKTGDFMDLSHFLQQQHTITDHNNHNSTTTSRSNKAMIVFATYAADFNAIEYVQRLRYYLPDLYQRGITNIGLVLNAEAEAAKLLMDLVDLPTDVDIDDNDSMSHVTPRVQLFIDPSGQAGRTFGVAQGWKPEDTQLSPFIKLFVMLFGIGAWATLPAVISGYIGNPFFGQPWIEDALAVGQYKKRWPDTALVLEEEDDDAPERIILKGQRIPVKTNKFAELPYGLGEWKRRPLELATLRLQNMLDISIKYWKDLAPTEQALGDGVLTQLGGCIVVDCSTDAVLYKWRDPGICAVANFEDLLRRVPN